MFRGINHRHKRNLSAHQKQIRFLTGLLLVIVIVATILIFWLVNWASFSTR
ncbi:MAG TPA: hypothetical protein VMD27_12960 [Candidatus Aquilonibacter sp.]|nr:hypothetical protein [Candidatus Aquilonibacter sp.]